MWPDKSATGQVTSERRRKPFQLARGAPAQDPSRRALRTGAAAVRNSPAYSEGVLLPLRPDRRDSKGRCPRLYGPDAIWKQVGQRLLDDTCQVRNGRHEEDGCWPSFE
jgi:hypothetical protein